MWLLCSVAFYITCMMISCFREKLFVYTCFDIFVTLTLIYVFLFKTKNSNDFNKHILYHLSTCCHLMVHQLVHMMGYNEKSNINIHVIVQICSRKIEEIAGEMNCTIFFQMKRFDCFTSKQIIHIY